MIKATSAESSFFACDTEYYLPWCTLAVYDPFLWRDKSSLRHMAMNKLTVFVVYNICSKKWLCCQQKCCQGPEELLQMSKLSLFSRYQRCCWDNCGEVHPFLRTLPVRRLNYPLSPKLYLCFSAEAASASHGTCVTCLCSVSHRDTTGGSRYPERAFIFPLQVVACEKFPKSIYRILIPL